MSHRRETIPLQNLLLDTENARHGKLDDQTSALRWFAAQQKTLTLARSIASKGINPSELITVMPVGEGHEGLYVVLEGNRRTSVLKMLDDPEKCPEEGPRRVFRKLKQDSRVNLPVELECVVYPDLESAAPWIEVRHLGEQEGAGIVPWGAKENELFKRRLGGGGPNDASMRLLEYAKERGMITQEEYDKIPLTNVTRLINTKDVRRDLGMDLRKGEILVLSDVNYFDAAVSRMLRKLLSTTVSSIKHADQRKAFIKDAKTEAGLTTYEVREARPLGVVAAESESASSGSSAAAGSQGTLDEKKKRTLRDPLSRKTAIPQNVSVHIQNLKMRVIFRELKDLDIDEFPNAGAVLSRVFIEGCADLYIAKHNLSTNNLKTLSDKVKRVRNHLVDSNPTVEGLRHDLKGLEVFAGEDSSVGSANSFNAVVHNTSFRITPTELKTTWDRLEPCLKWLEGNI